MKLQKKKKKKSNLIGNIAFLVVRLNFNLSYWQRCKTPIVHSVDDSAGKHTHILTGRVNQGKNFEWQFGNMRIYPFDSVVSISKNPSYNLSHMRVKIYTENVPHVHWKKKKTEIT